MKNIFNLLICAFLVLSCSEESENEQEIPSSEPTLSSDKAITAFKISDNSAMVAATMQNDSIFYTFHTATDLTSVAPTVEIAANATVSPASGVATDFSTPVVYTVTAEDNSVKSYTVVLTSPDNEAALYTISFTNSGGGQTFSRSQNSTTGIETITATVPYGTDVTALTSSISIPATASISPASGATLDYSTPKNYSVTAEDGTVREYVVKVVPATLAQVSIEGFTVFSFREVALGGDITFGVSSLHENLEEISVKLFSDQDEYNLVVKSVNIADKTITATLPANYKNNSYRLEVAIAPNNKDISYGFVLVKGSTNFIKVDDYFDNSDYHVQTTALLPGSLLNLKIYFKNDTTDGHSFFLKKNGTEYPLEVIYEINSGYLQGVRVQMPALANPLQMNGNDYELLIRSMEGDQLFSLKNSDGNNIDVVVASAPEVTGIANSTVAKDGALTIMGNHLFTTTSGDVGAVVRDRSTLKLKGSGYTYGFASSTLDANGNIIFDLGANTTLQSGNYTVYFEGNITQFPEINTNLMVTVTLPESEHPTLKVSEAKLYRTTSNGLEKQIKLNFNEDISGYTITKIVTGLEYQVEITNYFEYATSILTNALTDTQYSITQKNRDGYAIVMDNGQAYKVYFSATLTSL